MDVRVEYGGELCHQSEAMFSHYFRNLDAALGLGCFVKLLLLCMYSPSAPTGCIGEHFLPFDHEFPTIMNNIHFMTFESSHKKLQLFTLSHVTWSFSMDSKKKLRNSKRRKTNVPSSEWLIEDVVICIFMQPV